MQRNGLSHEAAGKLGAEKSKQTCRKKYEKRVAEYFENPKKCPVCGRIIPYEKRHTSTYCSRSCSATINNKLYPKRNLAQKRICETNLNTSTPRKCPTCGKPVERVNNKFCSAECAARYKYKLWADTASSGEFRAEKNGEARRSLVRRYLVERYGHRCSICGITEWQGKPAPLVVDHIDGNALNNNVANFRLVCGNCDMQLPTYKSKNKKGRAWRRKYTPKVKDIKPKEKSLAELRCPNCGTIFTRRNSTIPKEHVNPSRFYFCSRSCSTQMQFKIKRGEISLEQLEALHNSNIVKRYTLIE